MVGSSSVPHQPISSVRPSDEDILNFENQIRETEVNVHPLMSVKLPISILSEEYVNGPNPNFVMKIEELQNDFRAMRKSRGDGNCFFRAFSYGLVESIASLPKNQREDIIDLLKINIASLLRSAGFEKMAYDDFYDEFFIALDDPKIDRENDYLCNLWQEEPHRSHSLVVLLRLAASAYLRSHAQDYEPFIWEVGLDMTQYCQRFVECLGVESDQIHAIAVGKALNIDVEIAYLDGSDGPLSRLMFLADDIGTAPIKITLLYRPGHYDLLYQK